MQFMEGHHYVIEFLDHAVGGGVIDDPIVCQVSGWVVKDHKEHVVLTTWLVTNDDKEIVENNRELVSIIKSAILDSLQII